MSAFESFHDGKVVLYPGDCLATLDALPENSVDSVCCDPPYHLTSIVKRFSAAGAAPAKHGTDGAYARASSGFMGKQWDGGDIAFRVETWAKVMRALKPGGHLLAFSGTRTYHRMVCAIEDAGFEIRDQIGWAFGVGFPKSHDVSKGIDKAAGYKRGTTPDVRNGPNTNSATKGDKFSGYGSQDNLDTGAITQEAREWQGWGTALKPAWEPIVVARKPLEGTVAANVLKWGVGAINIDGCRVAPSIGDDPRLGGKGTWSTEAMARNAFGKFEGREVSSSSLGRWPANLVLSYGEDEYVLRSDLTSEQKRELYRWLSENA